MSAMKSFIDQKLSIMRDEYKKNPIRIYSDYNKEREALQSYHGRELLELLQNADDELRDDMKKEIFISFKNDVLTIANYGDPFDEDGIISLMYSNASEKKHRKKLVIGNKGTGFRAILGWAKEISIDSADLHVSFSRDYAQEVLKDLFVDNIGAIKGKKAATLVFPRWRDDYDNSEYTTVISIRIKDDDDVRTDIIRQIQTLNEDLLLFMNRTQSLVIELDNQVIKYHKSVTSKEKVRLTKYIDDEIRYDKEWLLNRDEGVILCDDEEQNYSIVIAYGCDGEIPKNQVIHSYFPTDVRFPFPVLLHANFELNADRNHLIKGSEANKEILDKAAGLLIDTAKKIYKGKTSYEIISFLIKSENLQAELVSYGFEDTLIDKIKESDIFPTVNKKYVTFSEELIFFTSPIAKYISGPGFENLLMYTEDEDVQEFVEDLGTDKWNANDAVDLINTWVKRHKANEEHIRHVAYTAIAFIDEYGNRYMTKKPFFFYNQDGKLIENDRPIFYLAEEVEITKPPKFVEVDFMLPYMRDYICKKLRKEYESKSDILERLEIYKVKEYNSEELLNYLKLVFEDNVEKLKKSQINKRWEQMMAWLWNNRKTIFCSDQVSPFYLKTRSGEYVLSSDLYAGNEYKNEFGERLFGKALPDRIIDDLRKYIGKDVEDDELNQFVSKLGVSFMPALCEKNEWAWYLRSNTELKQYIEKVYSVLTFPYKVEGDIFYSLKEMIDRTSHISLKHDYIDGIEEILSKCETADILEWIRKDDDLKQLLTTHKMIYASQVQWTWDSKQNDRVIREIKKTYSYVLHMFETIPWIQVQGERYRLCDCILSTERVANLDPVIVEPEISEYLKNVDGPKGKLRNEYTELFKDMGMIRDFSDFPVDKIYEVLLLLPDKDISGEIARSFYISLIKSRREFSDEELNCKKRQEFLNNGKVWCFSGYRNVKESFYLDGKDVCNKVANSFNLINVPKRLSSKRIESILGVKKLVLKGNIVGIPQLHPENSFFEKDFRKFLTLAFVYRVDSKEDVKGEARKFGTIDVKICSDIEVEYNNIRVTLDDYEYILEGTHTYYLKVPYDINSSKMKHNIQLSAAIANIISSYLDVNEVLQTIRELYNAGTNKDREYLIAQEFGDDAIILQAKQALNMDEDLKDEFVDIITRLSGKEFEDIEYMVEDIDFENFSEVSNAKPFITLFRSLNIDVLDYNNETSAGVIDLRPYYEGEIVRKLPLYEDRYRWTHYERLKGEQLAEKKSLVDNFLSFEETDIATENSVWFDCDAAIISQLRIDKDISGINLANKYSRERIKLKDKIGDAEYLDEFLQFSENMSLLYYGEIEELIELYNSYILRYKEPISVSEEVPEKHLLTITTSVTRPSVSEVGTNDKPSKQRNRKTGFSKPKSRNEQEKIGLLGERLVYQMLIEDETIQKVKWVSENAKKENVNPEGSAGKGYDIEYIDSEGIRRYIEVKSSKGTIEDGIRFYYSDNEYKFASEHVENYYVYYVCEVSSTEPKVLILDKIFVGDEFNEEKYYIESSSQYIITAEIGD